MIDAPRPRRLAKSEPKDERASIKIADQRTVVIGVFQFVALLGLTLCAVYQLAFGAWTPAGWLWVGMVAAALVAGAFKITEGLNWRTTRLVCGTHSLWIYREATPPREIRYADIAAYKLGESDDPAWITIELRSGEQIEVLGASILQERTVTAREFVQAVGPALPADVWQSRGQRPSNEVEAKLFDHFYQVPAVQLRPGVRYRYFSPEGMSKCLYDKARSIWLFAPFIHIGAPLMRALLRGQWTYFLIEAAFLLPLALLAARLILGQRRFKTSLNDRFEHHSEGLRIIRGDRSWIVCNPKPATGLWHGVTYADQPLIRYTDSRHSYYFDPRFIEPDA